MEGSGSKPPKSTMRMGGWGSGDEAGGGAPISTQASPRTHSRSPSPPCWRQSSKLSMGPESFAEETRLLRNLLAETHETFYIEDFEQEQALLVKNLDSGEQKCILDEPDSGFYGNWEDPGTLARSYVSPWDSWRQELRQNNEELWKAAETGSTEKLCNLLSPSSRTLAGPGTSPCMGNVSIPLNDCWKGSCEPMSPTSSLASSVAPSPAASFGDATSMPAAQASTAHEHPATSSSAPTLGITSSSAPTPGMMKVNVDSRSLHGRTALHIAASNGQAECMEALLRARADVDAQTDAGLTALHLASERGCMDVVRGLLAASCSTAAQTNRGELALHLAAAKGHTAILTILLEQCTHDLLGIRNSYGQRPAEVCQDIETNELLCSIDGSTSHQETVSSSSSFNEGGQDSYAGRTPFDKVLLRNSRADVVHRLLQRTGAEPKLGALAPAAEPMGADTAAGPAPARRGSDRRRTKSSKERCERRASFSKLRSDSQEAVGPDSFSLKSVLGKGSFGEVYQVVHRSSGQIYAMKVLRKSKIFGRNLVRYAMTERNLLSYIRHPFIVRLHYAFQTPTCLVLVLHFCPGGNLSSLIVQEGRIQETTAQLYIAEVFLAIEYLHMRQVVYRDMKPENVVLDEQSHAMLTDFGLSKEGVEGLQGTKSFCGSVAYLAPEILARRGHGPPVDLYGLGVLLFEMLAGRPPYYSRDRETLFRNIVSAALNVPSTASSRAASLIHSLMRRDPSQRLGARNTSEVRTHPFFFNLDFDRVLKKEVPVPPPRRQKREAARDSNGTAGGGKVTSPFEGRLEAQVRRSWSSASQDITGWEFATASPGERASQASGWRSSAQETSSPPSRRSSDGDGNRNSRRSRAAPVEDWLAPTFF